MIIYAIAAVVIPIALLALTVAIRERPHDRAHTYPPGSVERRTLETR